MYMSSNTFWVVVPFVRGQVATIMLDVGDRTSVRLPLMIGLLSGYKSNAKPDKSYEKVGPPSAI